MVCGWVSQSTAKMDRTKESFQMDVGVEVTSIFCTNLKLNLSHINLSGSRSESRIQSAEFAFYHCTDNVILHLRVKIMSSLYSWSMIPR